MLGHDWKMSSAKIQENRRNRRKACAPDNCVIDCILFYPLQR